MSDTPVCASLAWCLKTLVDNLFFITFSISMYIVCVCLFSALSCRVGALQISIIIIIKYKTREEPSVQIQI